jgi:hypothetical protein
VTGSASDYAFLIDTQSEFATGESLPILIYAADTAGNLMERAVFGLVAEGLASDTPSGSSYCGEDTEWSSSKKECVSTATTETVYQTRIEKEKETCPDVPPVIISGPPGKSQIKVVEKTRTVTQYVDRNVIGLPPTIAGWAEKSIEHFPVQIYALEALGAAASGWGLLQELLRRAGEFIGMFFFPKRRQKQWGTVYDQANGAPLPLARVQLIDRETGRVLDNRMTDSMGSYFFLVKPGRYQLSVEKTGYIMASDKDRAQARTLYSTPYEGNIIMHEDGVVYKDISMVLLGKRPRLAFVDLVARNWKGWLATLLFWVGFSISLYLALIQQTLLDMVVVAVYILIIVTQRSFQRRPTLGKAVGPGGESLPFVWITITRSDSGVREARTITDEHGNYFLMLNAGDYFIQAKSVDGNLVYQEHFHFGRRDTFNHTLTLVPGVLDGEQSRPTQETKTPMEHPFGI